MATLVSTGSPRSSRRTTPVFSLAGGNTGKLNTHRELSKSFVAKTKSFVALQPQANNMTQFAHSSNAALSDTTSSDSALNMCNFLGHLRPNEIKSSISVEDNGRASFGIGGFHKMADGKYSNHDVLPKQDTDLKESSSRSSGKSSEASSGSEIYVPIQGNLHMDNGTSKCKPMRTDNDEVLRIKKELEAARSLISRQEIELARSRNLKHTMEQAMGPASESDFALRSDTRRYPAAQASSLFNATAAPFTSARDDGSWSVVSSNRSEYSSNFGNNRFPRGRTTLPSPPNLAGDAGLGNMRLPNLREGHNVNNGYFGLNCDQLSPIETAFPAHRAFSPSSPHTSVGIEERLYRNLGTAAHIPGPFRNAGTARSTSTFNEPLSPIMIPNAGAHFGSMGQYSYHDRSLGLPLSPLSPDFPPIGTQPLVPSVPSIGSPTYVTPLEPMNYRRLLDKSVSCDWKYIVDKIVCNNDQQASIFLQQKLKVGTAEQKFEIVESIVNQAYPLMINRFGNFLVQRCFEHGTPEQVISIANSILGNVISLSMDPFGCHVIQKAFDSVPEEHKADMVRELLVRIPDTVIHRYACHVWQKLFELRWTGEPPQIMLKVNEALEGMWHEVALGETGSLVVQNIFENCVEEEKRPAINEVVMHIDLIAHGQFGNWCIQHLCEHGSPPDKRRVIDHILKNSYSYSIDQFASKVVEKCLKIGGTEFLDRYLAVITTARADRPRIPLIDIAGDQYGNYLIQWILMNTHQHQREQVAVHIRKHMVSLRGSKFGSRVAMLCSNPASVTRPGPPTATLSNPYGAPGQPTRTGWTRFR